jgi:hypothetical protein
MTVINEIAAERRRQIEDEGWSSQHDDQHSDAAMARAAACYALNRSGWDWSSLRQYWPWDCGWWKPKNPRHDLIRAGALIVAEIERLDRLARREPNHD